MTVTGKWMPATAGAFLAVVGGGAFWMMRASADSAPVVRADGLFPRIIAIGLAIFGVLAAARDFRAIARQVSINWRFRPCLLVTGSVIAFAVIIGPGGLLPAVFVSVLISAFGARGARLGQSIALALCVAAVVALLFVGLLGQPMKLIVGWP